MIGNYGKIVRINSDNHNNKRNNIKLILHKFWLKNHNKKD